MRGIKKIIIIIIQRKNGSAVKNHIKLVENSKKMAPRLIKNNEN